jgi:hypothetical protein
VGQQRRRDHGRGGHRGQAIQRRHPHRGQCRAAAA